VADELVESAEFGRKKKNEEEPILVAQRFLNIYRQMHIFNKERQDQFDDMLLALPSDIRILLSTLPGGSLLLEHIEEVEHKRGLTSPTIKTENNFRKKSANDLLQASAPAASKPETAPKAAASSGGGVVIDASFASELSNSLSFALQQTEKRYKDDIRTLTETITRSITESQSAIANMMKDILLASQNKSFTFPNTTAQNTNTSPTASSVKAPQPATEELKPQIQDTKPAMPTQSAENTIADKPKQAVLAPKSNQLPDKMANEHLSDKRPLPLNQNLIDSAPNNLADKIKVSEPLKPAENKPVIQNNSAEAENPLAQIKQALQSEPAKNNKQPAANNKNNQANKNINQPAPKKKNKSTLLIPEDVASIANLPNTPISLDDIPDTPISLDDIPDTSLTEKTPAQSKMQTPAAAASQSENDDDWEWEYVDENGNTESGGDDWEWEYVDDDGNIDDADNGDWEWEYVEDNDAPENKKS
jgi:hypothetical protein